MPNEYDSFTLDNITVEFENADFVYFTERGNRIKVPLQRFLTYTSDFKLFTRGVRFRFETFSENGWLTTRITPTGGKTYEANKVKFDNNDDDCSASLNFDQLETVRFFAQCAIDMYKEESDHA